MAISREQVEYVAKLARINLDAATLQEFTSQLDDILTYMEKLNELDTTDTALTSHALKLENVFRKDEPRPGLANPQALQNAPQQENGCFKVPKII